MSDQEDPKPAEKEIIGYTVRHKVNHGAAGFTSCCSCFFDKIEDAVDQCRRSYWPAGSEMEVITVTHRFKFTEETVTVQQSKVQMVEVKEGNAWCTT
jgi:hypothetical protein